MSTKVDVYSISARQMKNGKIRLYTRKTDVMKMDINPADYPRQAHPSERLDWMLRQLARALVFPETTERLILAKHEEIKANPFSVRLAEAYVKEFEATR